MCWILAGRFCAVMAAYAVASDIDVVEIRRQPADGAVTIIAGIATGNVCRVLANCDDAVVTATTGADNLAVIDHHHRREQVGRMTVFAYVGRLYVRRIFARCIRAVVATNAIAADINVIEIRR